MSAEMADRRLDVDLLGRELGNWRTASGSGPVYQGLADGLRMLIVDGRVPIGSRLPSERTLADTLRVSRTTVTAAYAQLREDGYLLARRGARATTALPTAPSQPVPAPQGAINFSAAAMSAPVAVVQGAYAAAAVEITPFLHQPGLELFGVEPLRVAIAERYCARGLPTTPDQIMVTTGALGALSLVLSTFVEPGDRVLVEQPTFSGALSAIAAAGARAVPVAVAPDEGWDLDALHVAVRQLAPNLAYLIPDQHNPTGLTMPAAQRHELARIISQTRTRTVIDETMTDIWLDEPVPAPVAAAVASRPDLVLTIGSMSKSFWGGMRVGWLRAERATLATLAARRPSVDLGTAIVEQLAAARLLDSGDDVLIERRDLIRRRRALLRSLLAEQLPDWRPCGVGRPTGGLALWMRLPVPMSSALSAAASRLGLDIAPGPRFGVDGTMERYIRVPYALPEDQLRQGVSLLTQAWSQVTGAGRDTPILEAGAPVV
ncbi:MAG TPA: PLP-dependent aminotransferase family protein [Mycobacterium sp.]|nr:PLP-dependent aminotransferase family protein [Mycobacterium sp.]